MASIIDYLNSRKQDSSFAARSKLAAQYGIKGYAGTAAQNTQLLGLLQTPQKPVNAPVSALSGSNASSLGSVPLKPSTAFVGAKTATPTAQPDPASLFSVSRPGSTTATTNAPGFQVAKPVNALGGSTSYAMEGIKGFSLPPASTPSASVPTVGGNSNVNLSDWAKSSSQVDASVDVPASIPVSMLSGGDTVRLPEQPQAKRYEIPSLSDYMKSSGGSSYGSGASDYGTDALSTEYDAISGRILSGMETLGNKGARKFELEKQAGLSDYQKQLNDINGQLAALNAGAESAKLDSQGKAIPNIFINRQVDAIERERTVKALGLSAVAATLQGNIALANDTVAKALDAEFSPIESKIEYLKTALQMNESKMTRAEKAKANEQAIKLKEYEMQVETQREEKKNVYDIALKAAENGASAQTINAIMGAKDAASALSYAGNSVADRSGGLSASAIQSTVNGIVNQFDGEPTVKNYQVVAEGYQFANSLASKKNPTASDDQGLLYAFAKAMDPNSVVREGEYATVQKYAQSWADSFGFNAQRIYSNSAFLTPEARQNMINTVKSKYGVAERSYMNIRDSYSKRIEDAKSGNITGSITDYSQGYMNNSPTSSGQTSGIDSAFDSYFGGFNSVPSKTQNGSLSQKYESGGNPGAIGYDSTGGYSYGKYQLAHNNAKTFVEQSPYAKAFEGLPFNSAAFRQRWQQVAKADPQGFGQAQEAYIAKTHLAPQAQKLSKLGLSFTNLSPTLQQVVFSTAVQHGPNTPIVANALAKLGPNAREQDLIKQIYVDRWNGGRNFASSTPAVRQAVYNRFFGPQGELATALKMSQQNYA